MSKDKISIQVLYPKSLGEEEVSVILRKASTPPEDLSVIFPDLSISKISVAMVKEHKVMYRSMLKEINEVLALEHE